MKRVITLGGVCLLLAAVLCAGAVSAAGAPNAGGTEESKLSSLQVSDAAMYRGTVVSLEETEAGTVALLRQEKGTDFGAETMRFLIEERTRLSFARENLVAGSYLEVFYGAPYQTKADAETAVPAISANLYLSAEMVNFNGTLEEIAPGRTEGSGVLVMTNLENGETVLFHYSADHSKIYLNLNELKAGDRLNIFHRGIFTLSLPPQGSLLEVRRMAEPDASFIGVVEEVTGNQAVVWVSRTEGALRRGDRVAFSPSAVGARVSAGETVQVVYDGNLMETYPIMINARSVERVEPNAESSETSGTEFVGKVE